MTPDETAANLAEEISTLLYAEVTGISKWEADVTADKIAAALRARIPADDGWQDIATAPKDGSPVLVFIDGVGRRIASWNADDWTTLKPKPYWDWIGRDPRQPALWQPLPRPPAPAKEEGE